MSLPELVERLSRTLESKNLMLATAESCTGGMIAVAITDRPGSTKIFDRGCITYSYSAKTEVLGVPEKLLSQNGAVSHECVVAMLDGALSHSAVDVILCTSGIAGPTGGTPDKPVGTVFIGITQRGQEPVIERYQFHGSRADIRLAATHQALEMACDYLEK